MTTKHSQDFSQVNEIIQDLKIAMLVTTDDQLNVRSRPMHTAEVDADNNIWFFTHDDSGKVSEVINDHHVNLAYSCPKSGQYLSVSGSATLIDDPAKKEELFHYFGKAWFPKGAQDPDLMLIKVNPEQAEYWESSSSKLVQLYKIVKAIATNERYEGGEHGKINHI